MAELVAAVIGDHSQLKRKWSVQKASSKAVQPAVWLLFLWFASVRMGSAPAWGMHIIQHGDSARKPTGSVIQAKALKDKATHCGYKLEAHRQWTFHCADGLLSGYSITHLKPAKEILILFHFISCAVCYCLCIVIISYCYCFGGVMLNYATHLTNSKLKCKSKQMYASTLLCE